MQGLDRDRRAPFQVIGDIVFHDLGQLAAGVPSEQILLDFPDLEPADITAALEYAAAAVQERELPLTRLA